MKKRSFSSQNSKDSSPISKNTPNISNSSNPNHGQLNKKNSQSSNSLNKNSIISRMNSNSSVAKDKNNLSSNNKNIISIKRGSSGSLGSIQEIPEGGHNSDFESNNDKNSNNVRNFNQFTNKENISEIENNNAIYKNSNISDEQHVNNNPLTKKTDYSLKRVPSIRSAIRKKNSLIESDKNNPFNNSEIIIKNYEEKKEISFFQKICNKFKKNFFLMMTVIFMIYIYYVYIFFYVVPLLYSSKKGLDYRFWYFLDDELYKKGFTYFLMFHFLLIMVIYSMAVSMFTDPGTISNEYLKIFDLLKNIDRKVLGDTVTNNKIENLILNRRSPNLTKEEISKIKNNSNINKSNFKSENFESEHLLNQTIEVENEIHPITMDSFQKLFNTDIKIKNFGEISQISQIDASTPHKYSNDTELYFKSAEFFFKFFYYTRELSLEKIRKNRNYCVFCKIIRPERSHHCKECRKCILRMDHHCGILNTCVGYYNYKPWVTFVFYSTAHLFLILTTMIDGFGFYLDSTYYGKGTFQCNIFIITFIIIVISFFSVGELFVTHLLYIMKGVTTIEDKSHSFLDQLIKSQASQRGIMDHIEEAIGNNSCNWFYPSKKLFSSYDGYVWLNGKSYEEFIIESRMAYLKTIDGNVQISCLMDKSDNSFSQNNISNFNDSIRKPL